MIENLLILRRLKKVVVDKKIVLLELTTAGGKNEHMNLLGRSGKPFLLLMLLCTVCMPGNAQSKSTATQSGLDTLFKPFRLEEVEARLRKMKASPERDYIAGMLANRENNTAKSTQLLVKALPAMRASRPDRAWFRRAGFP